MTDHLYLCVKARNHHEVGHESGFYSLRSSESSRGPFYGPWSPQVMRNLQDRFGLTKEHLNWVQNCLILAEVPLRKPLLESHVDLELRRQLKVVLLKRLMGFTVMISETDIRPCFTLVSYQFGVGDDDRYSSVKSSWPAFQIFQYGSSDTHDRLSNPPKIPQEVNNFPKQTACSDVSDNCAIRRSVPLVEKGWGSGQGDFAYLKPDAFGIEDENDDGDSKFSDSKSVTDKSESSPSQDDLASLLQGLVRSAGPESELRSFSGQENVSKSITSLANSLEIGPGTQAGSADHCVEDIVGIENLIHAVESAFSAESPIPCSDPVSRPETPDSAASSDDTSNAQQERTSLSSSELQRPSFDPQFDEVDSVMDLDDTSGFDAPDDSMALLPEVRMSRVPEDPSPTHYTGMEDLGPSGSIGKSSSSLLTVSTSETAPNTSHSGDDFSHLSSHVWTSTYGQPTNRNFGQPPAYPADGEPLLVPPTDARAPPWHHSPPIPPPFRMPHRTSLGPLMPPPFRYVPHEYNWAGIQRPPRYGPSSRGYAGAPNVSSYHVRHSGRTADPRPKKCHDASTVLVRPLPSLLDLPLIPISTVGVPLAANEQPSSNNAANTKRPMIFSADASPIGPPEKAAKSAGPQVESNCVPGCNLSHSRLHQLLVNEFASFSDQCGDNVNFSAEHAVVNFIHRVSITVKDSGGRSSSVSVTRKRFTVAFLDALAKLLGEKGLSSGVEVLVPRLVSHLAAAYLKCKIPEVTGVMKAKLRPKSSKKGRQESIDWMKRRGVSGLLNLNPRSANWAANLKQTSVLYLLLALRLHNQISAELQDRIADSVDLRGISPGSADNASCESCAALVAKKSGSLLVDDNATMTHNQVHKSSHVAPPSSGSTASIETPASSGTTVGARRKPLSSGICWWGHGKGTESPAEPDLFTETDQPDKVPSDDSAHDMAGPESTEVVLQSEKMSPGHPDESKPESVQEEGVGIAGDSANFPSEDDPGKYQQANHSGSIREPESDSISQNSPHVKPSRPSKATKLEPTVEQMAEMHEKRLAEAEALRANVVIYNFLPTDSNCCENNETLTSLVLDFVNKEIMAEPDHFTTDDVISIKALGSDRRAPTRPVTIKFHNPDHAQVVLDNCTNLAIYNQEIKQNATQLGGKKKLPKGVAPPRCVSIRRQLDHVTKIMFSYLSYIGSCLKRQRCKKVKIRVVKADDQLDPYIILDSNQVYTVHNLPKYLEDLAGGPFSLDFRNPFSLEDARKPVAGLDSSLDEGETSVLQVGGGVAGSASTSPRCCCHCGGPLSTLTDDKTTAKKTKKKKKRKKLQGQSVSSFKPVIVS